MNYEELVDRLGNLSRFLTGQDQTDVREAADAIDLLSASERLHADVLVEYVKKAPRWMPVKERMPSESDRYLTVSIEPWFGTTVVDTMRWSGVWMYDGRPTEATVTHWMPLPAPPEGD